MQNNHKKWLVGLCVLTVIGLVVCMVCYKYKDTMALKTTSEYQAVFLTNGHVYFGKLSREGKWMKLTDIYYIQSTQPLQTGDQAPANTNQQLGLVKLGGEIHGPEDVMYIDHDKIMFWENLKSDSRVVQTIKTGNK